jgi:hypothetical protein
MSDKGGNPKPTVAQGEQKKQDQQCKSGQRQHQYQQRHTKYKKKDPEEVTVLQYGPANNFSKFKEAMSKATFKNYGNLGRLIQLGVSAYMYLLVDCLCQFSFCAGALSSCIFPMVT